MRIHAKGLKRRAIRVRSKIKGSKNKPRLVVTRSSRYIYAQLIDDVTKKTLLSVQDRNLVDEKVKRTKKEKAALVGKKIAEEAKKLKITSIVFDRNGYRYHGRIQALADGAREGGLKF